MRSALAKFNPVEIVQPTRKHAASVLFLHGSGKRHSLHFGKGYLATTSLSNLSPVLKKVTIVLRLFQIDSLLPPASAVEVIRTEPFVCVSVSL